jgi:hypothetical protein
VGYHKYIRILEGNKGLARSLGAFIKRRDKITRLQWEKTIKPLMRQAENEVITKLKSHDLTSWGMWNLQNILLDIQQSIVVFTNAFQENMVTSQLDMAEFAADALGSELSYVGLERPPIVLAPEQLIANQIPMTEGFVEFFGDDMAKIVRGEISLGLVNGESVNQVAKRITRYEYGLEVAKFNPDARKIWIHNPSGQPRASHIFAQKRYKVNLTRLNELFYVGGETGRFPRDYSFSARNSVNCKCNMAIINKKDMEGIDDV